MYLYADQGVAGAPDYNPEQTGLLGSLGAGIAEGFENLTESKLARNLDAAPQTQWDLQHAVPMAYITNPGLEPYHPVSAQPVPPQIVSKSDYEQKPYAFLVPYKEGSTNGEYESQYLQLKLNRYYQAAQKQHPWATGAGGLGAQAFDPLWYIPVTDVLKVGVLGKDLFQLGHIGEAAAEQGIQAAAVTTGEGLMNHQEDDPSQLAMNVGAAFLFGGLLGGLAHGLTPHKDMLLKGMQKAVSDINAGKPVSVADVLASADNDVAPDLARKMAEDPNPDPMELGHAAEIAQNPVDSYGLALAAKKAAGVTLSPEEDAFLEGFKKDRAVSYLTERSKPPEATEPVAPGMRRLFNSGTGKRQMWTTDVQRAMDHGDGKTARYMDVPEDYAEAHRTAVGSEPYSNAVVAGNHPAPDRDYFFPNPDEAGPSDVFKPADQGKMEDAAWAAKMLLAAKAPQTDWAPLGGTNATEPLPQPGVEAKVIPQGTTGGSTGTSEGPTYPAHIQRHIEAEKDVAARYRNIAEGLQKALTCRMS